MADTKKNKVIKTYNKGECLQLETDDLTAILNMTIKSIEARGGRPANYENSAQGLEEFRKDTLNFFAYVNEVNANPEIERKLIPDIESWATFLGTTRVTILSYERRSTEWKGTIQTFKNAIAAAKKQLAMTYKIPPMVYVFDATNNHGYVNSNEFKLVPEQPKESASRLLNQENLQKQLEDSGLVWDEALQEYRPKEEG